MCQGCCQLERLTNLFLRYLQYVHWGYSLWGYPVGFLFVELENLSHGGSVSVSHNLVGVDVHPGDVISLGRSNLVLSVSGLVLEL